MKPAAQQAPPKFGHWEDAADFPMTTYFSNLASSRDETKSKLGDYRHGCDTDSRGMSPSRPKKERPPAQRKGDKVRRVSGEMMMSPSSESSRGDRKPTRDMFAASPMHVGVGFGSPYGSERDTSSVHGTPGRTLRPAREPDAAWKRDSKPGVPVFGDWNNGEFKEYTEIFGEVKAKKRQAAPDTVSSVDDAEPINAIEEKLKFPPPKMSFIGRVRFVFCGVSESSVVRP